MSSHESVTEWLGNLKHGHSVAAQQLWERYVSQLVRLARHKLGDTPRRVADEEDVAIMAFASFCQGVEEGRFPKLVDRDDLWQLLLLLTERTAIDQRRWVLADKRGGGEVQGESAWDGPDRRESDTPGVAQLVGKEPTPELAAQVAEELALRLGSFEDDAELQKIALDKLAGYTNQEIAERRGCGLRSVERQLNLIRKTWVKAT